jgi:hypothetical protein
MMVRFYRLKFYEKQEGQIEQGVTVLSIVDNSRPKCYHLNSFSPERLNLDGIPRRLNLQFNAAVASGTSNALFVGTGLAFKLKEELRS